MTADRRRNCPAVTDRRYNAHVRRPEALKIAWRRFSARCVTRSWQSNGVCQSLVFVGEAVPVCSCDGGAAFPF